MAGPDAAEAGSPGTGRGRRKPGPAWKRREAVPLSGERAGKGGASAAAPEAANGNGVQEHPGSPTAGASSSLRVCGLAGEEFEIDGVPLEYATVADLRQLLLGHLEDKLLSPRMGNQLVIADGAGDGRLDTTEPLGHPRFAETGFLVLGVDLDRGAPATWFLPGEEVTLRGCGAELNGKRATVRLWMAAEGCYEVALGEEAVHSLRPNNLQPPGPPRMPAIVMPKVPLGASEQPPLIGGRDSHGKPRESADEALRPDERARLAQQLRATEQRAALRGDAVDELRASIQRLQRDTASALEDEGAVLGEASGVRALADEHEETLRAAEADLTLRCAEHERQAVERRAAELDWREELDSMEFQRSRAKEDVAGLEANAARWRRSAAEQASHATKLQVQLKSSEQNRQELKSRGEQLRRQLEAQLEVTEEAVGQVQELAKQQRRAEPESLSDIRLWQVASGALVLLLLWLLIVDRPGASR